MALARAALSHFVIRAAGEHQRRTPVRRRKMLERGEY